MPAPACPAVPVRSRRRCPAARPLHPAARRGGNLIENRFIQHQAHARVGLSQLIHHLLDNEGVGRRNDDQRRLAGYGPVFGAGLRPARLRTVKAVNQLAGLQIDLMAQQRRLGRLCGSGAARLPPISFSKLVTAWLSADCEINSFCAARLMLPHAHCLHKINSCARFIAPPPFLCLRKYTSSFRKYSTIRHTFKAKDTKKYRRGPSSGPRRSASRKRQTPCKK